MDDADEMTVKVPVAQLAGVTNRAENAEQEAFLFQQLFRTIRTGIILVRPDADFTIFRVNLRTAVLFGYHPEELAGVPLRTLLPEGLRDVHDEHVARFFSSPGVRSMPASRIVDAIHRNGTPLRLEIELSSFVGDAGPLGVAEVWPVAAEA